MSVRCSGSGHQVTRVSPVLKRFCYRRTGCLFKGRRTGGEWRRLDNGAGERDTSCLTNLYLRGTWERPLRGQCNCLYRGSSTEGRVRSDTDNPGPPFRVLESHGLRGGLISGRRRGTAVPGQSDVVSITFADSLSSFRSPLVPHHVRTNPSTLHRGLVNRWLKISISLFYFSKGRGLH